MKTNRAALRSIKMTVARKLLLEGLEKRELFNVDWRNPIDSLDVSRDLFITPLDALLVINEINQNGSGLLPAERPSDRPYFDVTGDHNVSPLDALTLVNFLNSNGAAARTLADSSAYVTEQEIVITLGQEAGSRIYQLRIDATIGSSNSQLVGDLFSVYLVDPLDTSTTLLDRGANGTSLFSISSRGVEMAPGLARWTNGVLELDLTSVSAAETGLLKLQLINGSTDSSSQVRVAPISNTIETERDQDVRLATNEIATTFPSGIDIAGYQPSDAIGASTANSRYEGLLRTLTTEVQLRNSGTAVGRDVVLAFPNLPVGVTLKNASGVSSAHGPFIHLRDAIRRGGLVVNGSTDLVELTFFNPQGKSFDSRPLVLVGGNNVAPVLPPLGPFQVMPGETLEIELLARDPDRDLITYSINSDVALPLYELFAGGGLKFQPSPAELGTYSFTVIASDGAASTSRQVTLNVNSDLVTTTRLSGRILDVDGTPLAGLRVEVGSVQGSTNGDGRFELNLGSGSIPSDTLRIRGELLQGAAAYPFIAEKLPFMLEHQLYAGYNNHIVRPIYLPKLDMANAKQINPTATTIVTTAAITGAALTVGAGTLQNQQGTPFTGRLSITEVPTQRTPASIPDGLFPDLVVTIQPGEMNFSVPTALSLPNRAGQLPGTLLDLWSINPTTGEFEVVGQGRVSADGSVTETITGGVRNSSWHFFFPPLSTGSDNPANEDAGCPKEQYSCAAGSRVTLQTGTLVETHDLVTYQSLGQVRGLTLTYESERANPNPIFHVGYQSLNNSFADLKMAGRVVFPGIDVRSSFEVSTLVAPGLPHGSAPYEQGDNVWNVPQGQDSADGALQVDLSEVKTGIYSYIARTKLVTGENVLSSSTYANPYVHVNSSGSVFGRGWGLSGLKEAYVEINSIGSGGGGISIHYESDVLLVNGNGSEVRYTGGTVGRDLFQSPPGDFSTLRIDRTTGELVHRFSNGDVHIYRMAPGQTYPWRKLYRLTSVTDRNGNTTQYKYENNFGITSIVDPVGLTTRFEYTGGKVSRIIDPAGRATELNFAGNDLASIADPDGSRRSWSYDAKGLMVGETTKRGLKQVEQYDAFGRVTAVIHEDGTVSQYRPLAIRGLYPTERTINFASPPNAASQETNNTYFINATGNVVQADIDTRGQAVGQRDSLGRIGLTIRDENNNVTSRFDARDNATQLKYDNKGNVIEIADSLTVSATLDNPTISWTGASSNLWNEPLNWSENRIPSQSDDVLIPQGTRSTELLLDGLNTTVRRLYSYVPIRLNSARLTLLGDSRLIAGYIGTASFLTASGPQASLGIDLAIESTESQFIARGGGRVFVRGSIATTFERNKFQSDGSGSLISLPVYTDVGRTTPIHFEALNNGTISLAAMSSLRDSATLTAKNGGTVDLPSVTQMLRTVINLDADSFLYAPQWRELSNGSISVAGSGEKSFPGLTSISESSIYAEDGAQLVFTDITSYSMNNGFAVTDFRATGVGSEIRFPNLSSISGVAYAIRPQAQAGGLVSFPVLTETVWTSASTLGAGSRIDFPALVSAVNSHFAIGVGGQITLPNLITLNATPGNGAGSFTVEGSGVLDLPKFTSYESLAFTVSGSSRVNVPLLTRLKNSSISVADAAVFPIEQLTSIDESSVFAAEGAKLIFPNVSSYSMNNGFVVTDFRATGVGSEIRFPNLSSISGVAYAIRPQAQAGGLVSFPVLTDTVWTSASTLGAGSRIELPALVSAVNSHFAIVAGGQITLPNLEMLTATQGNGAGSFTVEGSGVFDLPKLTSYESLAFTLQGDARIDIPLLTQLKSGSLSLSGAAVFPVERLTSIDASSIFAGGGAKIVLPGITAFAMGDSFDVDRFQALGAGSEIQLPNLSSITNPTGHSLNSLRLEALSGGFVTAGAVTSAVNTLLYASGTGSIVDARGITQLPTVTILEESGGLVRRGQEGEAAMARHSAVRQDSSKESYGPWLPIPLVEGESPESGGEGPSESIVLPQQFRHDPFFGQMVFQSDSRGHQTHYKIDPTNGNILAVTRSRGAPYAGANHIERTLGNDLKDLQLIDLNDDQLIDAIYLKGNELHYAIANASGFSSAIKLNGALVSSFVVVNVGGDVKPEIYATSSNQQKLFKWSSLTASGFGTPVEIGVAGLPQFVVAADVDKDGDSDIIVATDFGGTPNPTVDASIVVYANDGTGLIAPASSNLFAIGPQRVIALAASDMDLDGNVDIAVQYERNLGLASTILLLWGNGTTNLTLGGLQDRFDVARNPLVKASDVNGDGKPDLLAGSRVVIASSARPVFMTDANQVPSSYYVPSAFVLTAVLTDIVYADLNNDGLLDRARAFSGSKIAPDDAATPGKIEIEFGSSGGGWGRSVLIDTGINPRELRIGNFNNSSSLDLSFVSGENGQLEVLHDVMDRFFGIVGDSDDEITRLTYLANGLVDTMVDPLGRTTDYDYDAFGRLVSTTSAKGTAEQTVTRIEYNSAKIASNAGLPTAFIDANGNRSEIEYDLMNRVIQSSQPDPDGTGPLSSSTTQREYDADGNLTAAVDAMGHRTTFEYDSRNRQVAVTKSDPDGAGPQAASRMETQYDAVGNPIAVVDALGHTERNQYDARNRLIATTDSLGGKTQYAYDRDNNLVSLTDPVGNQTQFRYDARNRMVAEIDPLGKQISYTYDGEDNLIEKIDRNGRMTTYAYDDLGRVIQEQWVGTTNAITYSYDGIGNLTKISDQTSSLTYTYDLLNRVRTVDNIGTPGAPRSILTYSYDAIGNVTAVVDTLDGGPGAATNYSYDAMNRLTRVTQMGQGLSDKRVDLAYNQAGQYAQIHRFSDLAGQNKVIATQFDYDQANRLAKIDHLNSANTAVGFFHYTYDSANRITSIAELDNVTQYTYDQTDQLTAANYSDPSRTDELYRYDANGNRLATHVAPSGYQTGAANRLVSDGVHTYTYDAEGNMITQTMIATGAVRTFVWDHRNRLVSVTDKLSDGTVQMHAGYVYDTLDRRIAKRVTQGSQPAQELHFIYDREDIIVDAGKVVGANAFEYKRYLHGGGIDEVFAEQAVGSEAHWLLTDHLGSVKMIVESSGASATSFESSSFGSMSVVQGVSGFRFAGRDFDVETNLFYYRARYYDSGTGPFLTEDPARIAVRQFGHLNNYQYVNNLPTQNTDPFGLWELFAGADATVVVPIPGTQGWGGTIQAGATYNVTNPGNGGAFVTHGVLHGAQASVGGFLGVVSSSISGPSAVSNIPLGPLVPFSLGLIFDPNTLAVTGLQLGWGLGYGYNYGLTQTTLLSYQQMWQNYQQYLNTLRGPQQNAYGCYLGQVPPQNYVGPSF